MTTSVRLAEPQLGNYLRPGRNDHTVLLQLLSEEQLTSSGIVIDATLIARQDDVVEEAGRQGIETVLDPRSMELSSPLGMDLSGISELPWAPHRPHRASDLVGADGILFSESLAEFAVKEGIRSVLAPTHFLESVTDPWLDVDRELVGHLRRALDSRGRASSSIYYPLALRSTVFYDEQSRSRIIAALRSLPIDGIWLRVHPFGTTSSGPLSLRRYIQACQDLHNLGLPIIAEHSGTVGVALLAFGAVGAIESGITMGEQFSIDRLIRPRQPGSGYLMPPRVYVAEIGAFLTRDQATSFYARRGMKAAFGCQDHRCCRHGWKDTISNPRRHFIVQRNSEVLKLSRTPEELRASIYLNEFLRPASEAAHRAVQAEPALGSARDRLVSWSATLGALLTQQASDCSRSAVPSGRRRR